MADTSVVLDVVKTLAAVAVPVVVAVVRHRPVGYTPALDRLFSAVTIIERTRFG